MPSPIAVASENAILLPDGVWLLRPELAEVWDFRIFVSVESEECLRRAPERDTAIYGSRQEVERRHRGRYIPSQRLYLAAARPAEVADVIVRNDDPVRPTLEVVASKTWTPVVFPPI